LIHIFTSSSLKLLFAIFGDCFHTMVNSVDRENSVAAGEKKEELVPLVFAADLAPNVRAGFDSMCDFIFRSHAALTTQIALLATRIDAMGDATARAPVQLPPAAQPRAMVQHRPAEIHDHRPVAPAYEGELANDANYAPQQRQFAARPAGAHRVQQHDRDRVGHAGRVPLDDGGLGRIKLSIPPFSGDRGPDDYLEWEMRMDQIFATHY
jgi:hypothetical protein